MTLVGATLRYWSTQSQVLRLLSGTPRSGTKTVSHTELRVRIRAALSPYHALARTRAISVLVVAAVAHPRHLFWVSVLEKEQRRVSLQPRRPFS